jgi:protein SCO1/2
MGAASTLTTEKSPQVKLRGPVWLWVALLVVPFVAVLAFAVLQPVKVRPRMGLAPGFSLVDPAGQRVTNEDLRGKLVLYNFAGTTCGVACDEMAQSMAGVQELLGRVDTHGLPVKLVTITVDPAHDTPERLANYAVQLGADPTRWTFLTGEASRIKNAVGGGFGVYYQADEGGQFKLDPEFVLVDGNGIMRANYKTTMPDLAEIQRDLELIVEEVQNSEGPGRLVYEAAHLFLCYPKS